MLLIFSLFYMALAYYLLPAVAITLKIRRRKLSYSSASLTSAIVKSDSDFMSFLDASLEQKFAFKDKQFDSLLSSESLGGTKSMDTLSSEKITFEAFTTKLSTKVIGLILQR